MFKKWIENNVLYIGKKRILRMSEKKKGTCLVTKKHFTYCFPKQNRHLLFTKRVQQIIHLLFFNKFILINNFEINQQL